MAEEEFVDTVALILGEVLDLDLRDRFRVEAGSDVVLEQRGMPAHQLECAHTDIVHDLSGHAPGDAGHGQTSVDAALEAGDADHEELVEVGREDREEPDAFEKRDLRIRGEVEDAFVEGQPAEFAIEEAIRRVGQSQLIS